MIDNAKRTDSELTAERIEAIRADARRAARQFVAELNKPLDPLTTYWDLTAAQLAPSMQCLNGHDWARAQPIFQAAVVEETKRLCRPTEGPDSPA
jgi:hypothetical protein